jgi:hypothetical protein
MLGGVRTGPGHHTWQLLIPRLRRTSAVFTRPHAPKNTDDLLFREFALPPNEQGKIERFHCSMKNRIVLEKTVVKSPCKPGFTAA